MQLTQLIRELDPFLLSTIGNLIVIIPVLLMLRMMFLRHADGGKVNLRKHRSFYTFTGIILFLIFIAWTIILIGSIYIKEMDLIVFSMGFCPPLITYLEHIFKIR